MPGRRTGLGRIEVAQRGDCDAAERSPVSDGPTVPGPERRGPAPYGPALLAAVGRIEPAPWVDLPCPPRRCMPNPVWGLDLYVLLVALMGSLFAGLVSIWRRRTDA